MTCPLTVVVGLSSHVSPMLTVQTGCSLAAFLDRTSSYSSVTSPSDNYDMISPAFWLVTGNYIKITRSDDSSNTALLYTSSCTGGKTFRSFITSFGNFRHGTMTHAEDPATRTKGEIIHPQWVSAQRNAAAIFRVAITCHSGVTTEVMVAELMVTDP